MQSLLLLSFAYWVSVLFLTFPPPAFVSSGISFTHLLRGYVGKERDSYVLYQVRRGRILELCHASSAVVYFLIPFSLLEVPPSPWSPLQKVVYGGLAMGAAGSLAWLFVAIRQARNLHLSATAQVLTNYFKSGAAFGGSGGGGDGGAASEAWLNMVAAIDEEVFDPQTDPIGVDDPRAVLLTRTWLLSPSMYGLNIARKAAASLLIIGHTTIRTYQRGQTIARQALNIHVSEREPFRNSFFIAIFASDCDRVSGAFANGISNPKQMTVEKSLVDQFVSRLQQFMVENSGGRSVEIDSEPEMCLAQCGRDVDVKIVTRCGGGGAGLPNSPKCTQCRCPPGWCLPCLGRWFAQRQNQAPELWLSGSAPCPTCRCVFCPYDLVPLTFKRPLSRSEANSAFENKKVN